MRHAYPIDVVEDDGAFVITCPDVPELVTQAETRADIYDVAQDALAAALSFYVEEGRPLPRPSPAKGRQRIDLPLLGAAKLALHARKLELGLSEAEFARRVSMDQKSAQRLLDPTHRSRVDLVEAALAVLNKRLVLDVQDAA